MTTIAAPALTFTVLPSPVGELTLLGADGVLSGLYLAEHRGVAASPDPSWHRDDSAFAALREQLDAYFDGRLHTFDVAVRLVGTPFQQRVWAALREIPYGETESYGGLAARIGQPTASRAVGLANGRNPVSIVVPCHRVIGARGDLTGYGGGVERKRALLALERGRQEPASWQDRLL